MLEPISTLPLFVFGDFLAPEFIDQMLERPMVAETSRLLDYELLELRGVAAAVVVESPGKTVDGRLYRRLSADDFVRLDAYAGVAEGLYRRAVARVVVGAPGAPAATPEGAFLYVPCDSTLRRYG